MTWIKLLIPYVIAFLASLLLTLLGVNPIIIFLVVFSLFFPLLILPKIIPIYFSNNVHEIESFLLKNSNRPEYQLYYGLAEHNKEVVHEAMKKLFKNPMHRAQFAIYETILALLNEDFVSAKTHIEKIKQGTYQSYYRAMILIEENHFMEADQIIETIRKPWMVEALKSQMAMKKNLKEEAKVHAIKSIDLVKGLQKYVLFKTFERELGIKIIS